MSNQTVKVPVNKSFRHKLSHRHTTTLDYFRLQPVVCTPMIPGDQFPVNIQTLVQSAPLATQVFGNVHLDLHAFFVPNRLVWDEWEPYFLGDGRSTDTYHTFPYMTNKSFNELFGTGTDSFNQAVYKERRRVFGSLGYPVNTNIPQNFGLSVLQARAYQRIWWDYYRDSVNIPEKYKWGYLSVDGGVDTSSETFACRYRTFKKDYITTLLESPQMGDSSTAFVNSNILGDVANLSQSYPLFISATNDNPQIVRDSSSSPVSSQGRLVSSGLSIPLLRGAVAMQRYLERINVTGTRPMERLLSLLGVKASAERLDMAEFIGATSVNVNIDGLVNNGSQHIANDLQGMTNAWGITTSGEDTGTPVYQGYQTGYAHGRDMSKPFNYTAKEHGFFIVIASLVPEYSNPNAMNRQFIRGISTPDADRNDFYNPDFDGVGYQEMLLSEVCMPTSADNNPDNDWSSFDPFQVVGYQPKYEDYRIEQDRISGDFNEATSAKALRNMVFTRSFQQMYDPEDITAGLRLTTATFADRAQFDNHFQVSDSGLDHFVLSLYVDNVATRPVSANELPTELSDMANSSLLDVANGGVRL